MTHCLNSHEMHVLLGVVQRGQSHTARVKHDLEAVPGTSHREEGFGRKVPEVGAGGMW